MKNSDFWYLVATIYIAQHMPVAGAIIFSCLAIIYAVYFDYTGSKGKGEDND